MSEHSVPKTHLIQFGRSSIVRWKEESSVIQKVLYNDQADLEQIHRVPSVFNFQNQKALSDSNIV